MNDQITMLNQQIQGYEAKIDSLRADEKVFHKAQGLEESAEKTRAEVQGLELDIDSMKEDLSEKQSAKTVALAGTMDALSKKMSEILPEGKATFQIDDGALLVGWTKDKVFRPHLGLSGGELVTFNAALSFALLGDSKEKVLIMEAAELDSENLMKALDHLGNIEGTQLILSTCHFPTGGTSEWEKIVL